MRTSRNRQALKEALESEGFQQLENEWWHFDYKDWKHYRIGNERFEQIESRQVPR